MNFIAKEFVSHDQRTNRNIRSTMIASALAGFVAGAAVASIVFLTGIAFSVNFLQW